MALTTQQKVDSLLQNAGNPEKQMQLLKDIIVRQAIEYEVLLGKTLGKRKSSAPQMQKTSAKRRKVEPNNTYDEEGPLAPAPDDDDLEMAEETSNFEQSSTGPTGSLQGVENMTKFNDSFEKGKQRGHGGKLPKPGQISRADEEMIEKSGGDYESHGVETIAIAPSKTNKPRTSALQGSIRGGQNSHGGHPQSQARDTHVHHQDRPRRRSRSRSREDDEEPAETLKVFGSEIDRKTLENMPVLDEGSNKLNTGFRLVEKALGEEGRDKVASIGSKGGRHSHDNDNRSENQA